LFCLSGHDTAAAAAQAARGGPLVPNTTGTVPGAMSPANMSLNGIQAMNLMSQAAQLNASVAGSMTNQQQFLRFVVQQRYSKLSVFLLLLLPFSFPIASFRHFFFVCLISLSCLLTLIDRMHHVVLSVSSDRRHGPEFWIYFNVKT
jgi:hypothetical protein